MPLLLYLGPFATMLDRFAVAPMLIPIAVTFQVTLTAASGAASLYYLAYGLMPPVYGILSDRLGRVRVIQLALAGMAVTDVVSALAPNLAVLLLARCLTGGIACGVFPTTLVYLGDRFVFKVRQHAIANTLVVVALGTAAGTIGAGLAVHFWSWRVFFLVPAIIGGVVAAVLGRVPETLTERPTQNPLRQIGVVLRSGRALSLLGLAVIEGAVMFGLVTYLAPALEASGHSPAIAGAVLGSYGLSVLICTWAFGHVARRTSAALMLGGGASMLMLGFLIAAGAQNVPAILAASVLAGGAYTFMHSTIQTWATDVVPEARATATSLFVTSVFAGAGLATYTAAGLASLHQYRALFLIGAVLTVPVAIGGSLARRRYRGSDAAPVP